MANATVSEYEPTARLFALVLIETMMFVLPPAASVPLVAESVSQVTVLVTDQTIATPPVLLSVYVWLLGLKGPNCPPLEENPDAGLTASCAPLMNRSLRSVAFAASPSQGPTLKSFCSVSSVELCV